MKVDCSACNGSGLVELPSGTLDTCWKCHDARRKARKPKVHYDGPGEPADLQPVLACLEGVVKNSLGWMARCPGHKDRGPSLSVTLGRQGHILLNCFAGCAFEEVQRALPAHIQEHLFAGKSKKAFDANPWLKHLRGS